MLPPTRDDVVLCGVCPFLSKDTTNDGVAAALGTSSLTTTSAGGGRGGGAHKPERYLLFFAGSELSHHLRHINAERE